MSVEGEKLLIQIDRLVAKSELEDEEVIGREVTEIEYNFDRPDIDFNRSSVLGIISILINSERRVEPKLKELLNSPELREKIINIKGSNSIKEDIEEGLVQILSGKKVSLPTHPKKPSEKKKSIKDVRGRFFSLANLQVLLNTRLHDKIKENMGKGNAKTILNYRSGRFANSAEVKKLTSDRDGTISAFYTYMKYPYATFEPGNNQGNPASRDPRLLISKSIRQLATTIVTNRLKAIVI